MVDPQHDADDMQQELARVSAALRRAREWARKSHQTTTREFAAACGVTPTELSRWTMTMAESSAPPDFVCHAPGGGR